MPNPQLFYRLKGLTTRELGELLLRYPELEVRVSQGRDTPAIPASVARVNDYYNPIRDKMEVFVEVY